MGTVNHPKHYNSNGRETIEKIEDALTPAEYIGGLKFNVIKYLDRYEFKNGSEDIEKAKWYARRLIYATEATGEFISRVCWPLSQNRASEAIEAFKHLVK